MNQNKNNLSWEDFQKMGNPENAPDLPNEEEKDEMNLSKQTIRIHLDRIKGNKTVTVIKGLVLSPDNLSKLAERAISKKRADSHPSRQLKDIPLSNPRFSAFFSAIYRFKNIFALPCNGFMVIY